MAFGFVQSKTDPPVPAEGLAAKWATQMTEDTAAELSARAQGSCTRHAFDTWFAETHGAILSASVAQSAWEAAATKTGEAGSAAGSAASVCWEELHKVSR